MKVLFLALSFSEGNDINFYEDLLQELIKKGHEVFVACASERRKKVSTHISMERNINILRIKTGNITGNVNLIEKGISTLFVDYIFKKNIKKYYQNQKFDLVLYPTPPVTFVNTITWLKNKQSVNTYLMLKDIFPQNAIDLGMLSKKGWKSIIYKIFSNKEKKLYNVSDYIGCMSPANVTYLLENYKEINPNKVEVCPNCIKVSETLIDKSFRKKYDIPLDKTVFLYGGNLGKPQGIPFLKKCLKKCSNIKNAFFLIIGGGSDAKDLENFINDNRFENVKFISRLPKFEYEALARSCDVGLVFLDYRFTIPNFPSRILSYMDASMPIIVASDPNTDMGDIVQNNEFGWKCLSNDVMGFYECIENALQSDLVKVGKNGNSYLKNHYTVEHGAQIILKHFENIK